VQNNVSFGTHIIKYNGGHLATRWAIVCSKIDFWGFVSCQSNAEKFLISYKFASWQEHFEKMSSLDLGHTGLLPQSLYPSHL